MQRNKKDVIYRQIIRRRLKVKQGIVSDKVMIK